MWLCWILRNIHFILSLAFFALIACGENTELPTDHSKVISWVDPLGDLQNLGHVRFNNPQVGQRSVYLEFDEIYDPLTGMVLTTYTGDTLILGITAIRGDTLEAVEYYSQYSVSRTIIEDSSFQNSLNLEGQLVRRDSLFVNTRQSFSYIFMLANYLPLTDRLDTMTLHGSTVPVYNLNPQEWIARVENYQIGSATMDTLIGYFDYADMATDGLGFSWLYSNDLGIVRSAYVSPWEYNKSKGWDLMID